MTPLRIVALVWSQQLKQRLRLRRTQKLSPRRLAAAFTPIWLRHRIRWAHATSLHFVQVRTLRTERFGHAAARADRAPTADRRTRADEVRRSAVVNPKPGGRVEARTQSRLEGSRALPHPCVAQQRPAWAPVWQNPVLSPLSRWTQRRVSVNAPHSLRTRVLRLAELVVNPTRPQARTAAHAVTRVATVTPRATSAAARRVILAPVRRETGIMQPVSSPRHRLAERTPRAGPSRPGMSVFNHRVARAGPTQLRDARQIPATLNAPTQARRTAARGALAPATSAAPSPMAFTPILGPRPAMYVPPTWSAQKRVIHIPRAATVSTPASSSWCANSQETTETVALVERTIDERVVHHLRQRSPTSRALRAQLDRDLYERLRFERERLGE